jgi:hypothetical protein
MMLLASVITATIAVLLCNGAIVFLMEALQEDNWVLAHGVMDGAGDPLIVIALVVASASFVLFLWTVSYIIRGLADDDRNHQSRWLG